MAAAPVPLPPPDSDRAVAALLSAIELRNPGNAQHAERVAQLGLELAQAADPELAATVGLGYAFLLHDIGKLGIPDSVLLKPGPLTASERRIVETHTILGLQTIWRLRFLPPVVRDVVGCHHERWDGSGYPHGLGGWAIPIAARVFSVADSFDAMTSDRPYRQALSEEEAVAEIERCAGTQFDPWVVEAFLQLRHPHKGPRVAISPLPRRSGPISLRHPLG